MAVEITSENLLYEPTSRFLNLAFPGLLSTQHAGAQPQVFADIVADRPSPDSGRWTRPDLACLAVSRGEFVPFLKADLHTFEVKTASGLDETSVHEAHAHGRFGHYTWLAFQAVGRAAPEESTWYRVQREAVSLGVGLIYSTDPDAPHDWHIDNWPSRTSTNASVADRFVAERFSPEIKERIAKQLASLGWKRR